VKSLIIGVLFLCLVACSDQKKELENDPKPSASAEVLDDLSIYQLPSTWKTQANETIQLKDLHGNVVVMVMIYTSCQASCPRLVADMRHLDYQVESKYKDKVKFVLISIDPETDTPERLAAFAKENEMTDDQWVFLQGTPETVQEVAVVLGMKYKKVSPIDFSHSNIISVFDDRGVLQHQKEGLGIENAETRNKIVELYQSI
jgi:protein SCO1/2